MQHTRGNDSCMRDACSAIRAEEKAEQGEGQTDPSSRRTAMKKCCKPDARSVVKCAQRRRRARGRPPPDLAAPESMRTRIAFHVQQALVLASRACSVMVSRGGRGGGADHPLLPQRQRRRGRGHGFPYGPGGLRHHAAATRHDVGLRDLQPHLAPHPAPARQARTFSHVLEHSWFENVLD